MVAFNGTDSAGGQRIYVRPLSSLEAYPLQGTERAIRAFWSPDSKYLAYFANSQLMKIPVSGGPPQLVCETYGVDGSRGNGADIWKMDVADSSTATKFIATGHTEFACKLSPDEKYLAYASNETGTYEVYLWKLTDNGGKWQVSAEGGRRPNWSKNGQELFYHGRSDKLMVVKINTTGKEPDIGVPEELFSRRWDFDVSNEGDKFLFVSPISDLQANKVVVVMNWQQELQEK